MKRSSKRAGIAILAFIFLLPFLAAGQDESYYNNQAYQEYQSKNYTQCIAYCNQSLNIKPNGWAYYERASSKYALLDYPGTLNDFTLALPYYKDGYLSDDSKMAAYTYYWRGQCNLKLRNYTASISDFNDALNKDYDRPKDIYWNGGVAYFRNGDLQKALDYYDKAINLSYEDKDLTILYENRGLTNKSLWKLNEALVDFNKAIEKDDHHTSVFYNRAIVRSALLDYDGAIGDVTRAIDYFQKGYLSGNDQFTLNELYDDRGLYRYYARDYANALADFNKSIELNPGENSPYWNRGLVYETQHDYKAARESYGAAIPLVKTDKSRVSLYRNKAIMGKYLLEYRSAIADCAEALKYDPNYKSALWTMAELQGRVKNYSESVNYYAAAISAYSSDSSSLSTLYRERGRIRSKMKDNTGALADFKSALLYNGQNEYAFYDLGRFYKESLKNAVSAKLNLDKAASLSLEKNEEAGRDVTYAYAKVIGGDLAAAEGKMNTIIKKFREDKYEYPWQLYNMACIQALGKNFGKAIDYLDRALEAGFYNFDHMQNDYDLDVLRNLPAFKSLLVKYEVPAVK